MRRKGGQATGPSPVDCGKTGSKHRLICDGKGTPFKVIITAANVNDVTQTLALVDDIPPVAGKPGRPRRRPDALLGDRATTATQPPRAAQTPDPAGDIPRGRPPTSRTWASSATSSSRPSRSCTTSSAWPSAGKDASTCTTPSSPWPAASCRALGKVHHPVLADRAPAAPLHSGFSPASGEGPWRTLHATESRWVRGKRETGNQLLDTGGTDLP
ncbi:transposase [Streptomyces sp. MMBL 11-3]|uniref:transposase n=1 Tax=Streptomyces sp. MMBL 11-3 TaxID=3382639 RepID=UPI0039B51CF2